MNSTEIFYNNGQLNWDAINTISNIVLVTALVLITVLYAYEIRKQTRLMIKDRERNKVSEEVREVLTPAIEHIESEIDAIQNKKILWHRHTSGDCGFDSGLRRLFYNKRYVNIKYLFSGKGGGSLQDILNKFPALNSMFSSHDFLIDELNHCYEEIEKEIKTPELKERFEEMAREFRKEKSDTCGLTGDYITNPFRFYGEYLINLEYTIERSPDSIEPNIDFWEENQNELLKFRDKYYIIEVNKQISEKLIQLNELNRKLLKNYQR